MTLVTSVSQVTRCIVLIPRSVLVTECTKGPKDMDSRVLTPELAGEIADETTRILGHNVLITDENSQVIGSGDISRVGTVHEASVGVVKSGVAASHDAEEAAALVGVRPGITMPIVLD